MIRFSLVSLLLLAATPSFAQSSPIDEIIETLKSRGYRIILQERTWLGRERILAETSSKRRELVFNPATGEIMRDYVSAVDGHDQPQPNVVASGDQQTTTRGAGYSEVDTPMLGVTLDQGSVLEDPIFSPSVGTTE